MRKVQLTLTNQEAEILGIRASQLGYNLAKYIRLLLGKEIVESFEETKVPVFKMSHQAEEVTERALKEYQENNSLKLKSLDDLDKI